MNVFRVLAISAAVGGAMAVLALTIQQPATGDETPDGGGQVGEPATPGEVDDPDPDDPETQDVEVQDLEVQEPEIDDPDPDDPDPGVPGPTGARGPAGTSSDDPDDPDPDDPDPDDPEIQNPEIQNPEVDDPDPGGFTCPEGTVLQEVVIFQPGGQGDDVPILACVLQP